MNRRLGILLTVVLGTAFLAGLQYFLFSRLGPTQAIFLQLAYLGVVTALGTVLARNLIHAALFLVAFFFLIACLFVLLEAEFLAAMQVLVYIGAIAILMMFGILLTKNIQGDEGVVRLGLAGYIPAVVVAGAFLGVMIFAITQQRSDNAARTWANRYLRAPALENNAPVQSDMGRRLPRADVIDNMSQNLGRELMTRWVIPFEVAGLMLTAAVVGAIALAKIDDEDPIDVQSNGRAATRRNAPVGPAPSAQASEPAPQPVSPGERSL